MRVAFDTSPINNLNRVRGVGTYTANLLGELKKSKEIILLPFEKTPPPLADVIHYPYFDLFFHTLPLKSNIKRIVTIHDVIPLVFPKLFPIGIKGKLNLYFQKKALKNVDLVITDSKSSKADISKFLSYPSEKIRVIYLAPSYAFKKIYDEKILRRVKSKYKLSAKFILYVGDVNPNKNLKNLLKAISIAKVNLVMVGEALGDKSNPLTKAVYKQIRDEKIEAFIKILGYVDQNDLVTIYNLANATILPSLYEGFGLPVLESMACGTPVVCTMQSSLPEIGGEAAIYCDPLSSKNIALKISKVLQLKTENYSQMLIKHALKFSWKKTALETLKVYIRLQNSRFNRG